MLDPQRESAGEGLCLDARCSERDRHQGGGMLGGVLVQGGGRAVLTERQQENSGNEIRRDLSFEIIRVCLGEEGK